MLMGPRGRAAANPMTVEIKKRDDPVWCPERKLWANMVPVHTGNDLILHGIKAEFKRRSRLVHKVTQKENRGLIKARFL